MKINYFIIGITFLLFFISSSQIITIPDTALKNALVNENVVRTIPGSNTGQSPVDLNNDGEIQVSEALFVTDLLLPANRGITSLEGIQAFTNLISFEAKANNISIIPALNIPSLKYIDLGQNNISSFNLSGTPNIEWVIINDNLLSSIDVTQSAHLWILHLSNNNISNLDLSQNPDLLSLEMFDNPLTAIDLNNNLFLESLQLQNTLITQLDLSNQQYFFNVDVSNTPLNQFTGLSNKFHFDYLKIENTQISSLSIDNIEVLLSSNFLISNNPLLTDITISNSRGLILNINNNPNLINLSATDNDLDGIITSNNMLINVILEGNVELGNLSFINETQLVELNINNSSFQNGLDLTNCSIHHLFIKNGRIDAITFSGNNNIDYLCADNIEHLNLFATLSNAGLNNVNLNNYCTFNPGGDVYKVTGEARIDSDLNGCSTNDLRFTDFKFEISNGTSTAVFFESPGYDYEINLPIGNYTINPEPIVPALYNPTTPFSASFSMGSPDIVQDICLTPNGTVVDFSTIMFEDQPARPGFDANYILQYKNNGTAASNGVLFLNYDDARVDFISSNLAFSNNSGGNLRWDFGTMQPNEERQINLIFNINSPMEIPAVNGGDILVYNGNISPPSGIADFNTLDNDFEYFQTVVNSFDPNDITCLEGKNLNPTDVGEYLHYKVRFENTGTASAVNIVVKNEIDLTKLDITSLVPITSSHDMRTRITDGNVVEFIFENINLDFNDATNDGYLIYKIKSLPSLQLGDAIGNQAEIYFDFNFPIITNDYMVTVAQTASINDVNLNTVKLYPNPTNDTVKITSQSNIKAIKIFDHLGRIVKRITLVNEILEKSINLSNLKTGLYFVEVEDKNGKQTVKLAKE